MTEGSKPMDQWQEIVAFVRIYVQDEELEFLCWTDVVTLAIKRDRQAAEQLRLDCGG
jgi:hypothetical protein